jgi:hypothetical protein
MRISSLAAALGFALSVLSLIPAGIPAQAQQKGTRARPKEDAFLTGPPFTFNDLMQRIGIIADKRMAAAIEKRGITFAPTERDYERIRQAGAGPELIQAIKDKAPAPPPPPKPVPPPPPAHAGKLTLQCLPSECDVLVNGQPRGTTTKGILVISELPVGDAIIDFRKAGFEGQQVALTLRAGMATTRFVTLKPTVETQAHYGKLLLEKMAERLGGRAAFQQSGSMNGSGKASLWQAGGQQTDWMVTTRLKPPSMALIEIAAGKQKWWTSLSANDCKTGGSKQMASSPVAKEMERLVRFYRDYQPALLLERLRTVPVSTPDDHPDANGLWLLRATLGEGSYLDLTLDSDATPQRAVYKSPSGPGAGHEILYADYAMIDKSFYPRAMTIRFTDQPHHGLELHLSELEFAPKLSDKEFHR